MSDLKEIEDKLGSHAARVKELGEEIKTLVESESAESKARLSEVTAEQKRIADAVGPLLADKEKAEQADAIRSTQAQLESLMASTRTASKAGAIGSGRNYMADSQYKAGSFLASIADLKSGDPDKFHAAKATLEGITAHEESWGKATLGTSDAVGGWIVPNALVDELIKPAAFNNFYSQLVTNVNGVTSAAVDLPFRIAAPNRAVIAPFGSTKENVDLVYNGYTATMYTLARVHDVGNQFLRQSQGAAEQDVLQELATAFALGERYYIVSGSGSSEPYGLQTAIANAPATFTSSFSAAATLAGSIISAIATAAGALANRERVPNAAVINAAAVWTLAAQGGTGADTGFFLNGAGGVLRFPDLAAGQLISPFGIPVFGDSQLAADDLIVGDFKALKVFHGQNYRVDSSSVAGTRWDANVTGFRGEMELGLDARPAVYSGAFQFVADILP